jgi:hypothetical protein
MTVFAVPHKVFFAITIEKKTKREKLVKYLKAPKMAICFPKLHNEVGILCLTLFQET